MTPKATHFILLGALVAALVIAFSYRSEKPTAVEVRPKSALALVPPGAAFVLSVDIAKLRNTPLAKLIAGGEETWISDVQTLCGFDPLLQVNELVLAVPGEHSSVEQDFALIARGELSANRVASCAVKLIERRSGQPVRTRIGTFETVRDRAQRGGEVAVTKDLLIVGGGSYLRDLLDRAEGNVASEHKTHPFDALHAALREKVGSAKPVIATCVLPPGLLERKLGKSEVEGSPLTDLRAIALAVELGDQISVESILGCANPSACGQLESLVRDAAKLFLKGDRAAAIEVERSDLELQLRTKLTYQAAASALKLVITER